MLTMFGLIKKKLQDSGDLRLKYQGFVGQLYYLFSGKPYNLEAIVDHVKPYDNLDLTKTWSLTAKFTDVVSSTSILNSEIELIVGDSLSWCGANSWEAKTYLVSRPYGSSTSNNGTGVSLSQSQVKNGLWLRTVHEGNSKIRGYYSLDGKTFKDLGSRTYKGVGILPLKIGMGYGNSIAKLAAKDVEFIYDGKLVFGRVE